MSSYAYEKKFDVVIVGAGVIGCSIAYHLAKESGGKLKIAVIERNTIGEEASAGAAGMLAAQTESDSPGPFMDLALRSRSFFEGLAAELRDISGVDAEYSKSGIVSVAYDEAQDQALKRRLDWQAKAGLSCLWLSGGQVREKFPFLKPTPFGGFLAPEEGQVASNRLVAAFAVGAKKLGVSFFECESFDEAALKEPRVDFLETNLSKFIADKFIFAAGAWTGKLLNQKVKIEPVKGQILIFEIPLQWRRAHHWEQPVFLGLTQPSSIHCYCVPKRDGSLWVGATMEDRGMDKSENAVATEELTRYLGETFPEAAKFPFKGVWVGLRPAAPDRLPVLGLAPGFQNVYVAGGHFRNGILLAPITGRIFSELLLKGKSGYPIGPFSPDRFKAP